MREALLARVSLASEVMCMQGLADASQDLRGLIVRIEEIEDTKQFEGHKLYYLPFA